MSPQVVKRPWVVTSLTIVLALVSSTGIPAAWGQDHRCDWSLAKTLYPGILLRSLETDLPRKLVVHGARVDLQEPELRWHVTDRRRDWVEGKTETDRQTTRDFLRQARQRGIPMVLAINADAFSPWPAPFDQPTPTDLLGLAVSNGKLVSRGSGTPSLLRSKAGSWRIASTGPNFDITEVELAVSGFAICLEQGQPVPGGDDLHPRTGLGLSQDGRYLVMVVIDGRQPASAGATTHELGRWLLHFGAHQGINMDGGGSTTLAWWNPSSPDDDKCELLNRPVGSGVRFDKLPAAMFVPTERANGNNLGVALEPATR